MADQADWPDIYIDSSVGDGGVGSEADPYNELGDINWTGGGDNCVETYMASPTQSVTINLQKGEVWRGEPFHVSVPGTASYPFLIRGYGSGANPLIDGSTDVSTASYRWTPTTNWTSSYKEYFLEDSGGGTSGIDQPTQVFIDDVRCLFVDEVIGSLSDHGFTWGTPPGEAFETIVLRDESGDPDDTGAVIDASLNTWQYIMYLDEPYYIVDGIDLTKSAGHGCRFANKPNCEYKNAKIDYTFYAALQIYPGATDCVWRNIEVAYVINTGLGINGSPGETYETASPIERLLVTGCTIHDTIATERAGWYEGSGTKAFNMRNSVITKNTWYNCPSGAIRLDGGLNPYIWGCEYNEISENEIYGCGGVDDSFYVQMELEFSRGNTIKHNYFHDPWGGGPNFACSHSGSDNNKIFGNIFDGSYAPYWMSSVTNQTYAGDAEGAQNEYYNNIINGAMAGFKESTSIYTVFKNNIISNTHADGYDLRLGEDMAITSDYNRFSGTAKAMAREDGIWKNYTLAEWQAAKSNDLNSSEGDPGYVDGDNKDFEIASGSACISTGDDLGEPFNEGILEGSSWPDAVLIGDRDDY